VSFIEKRVGRETVEPATFDMKYCTWASRYVFG
jgi:hypothetical protein